MKTLQYFTDEYLAHCRAMSTEQICDYLESFRTVASAAAPVKRKLISLRVKEPVLAAFKQKSLRLGVPYQTQLHTLMEAWVSEERR